MATTDIVIRGAREHNLRDVSLDLPARQADLLHRASAGSGKSSLAFDTLYAEGQRRYVESLSSYARQFLGQMPKPEVDRIDGLSPSISIQQKTGGRNPRIDRRHDHRDQRLPPRPVRPGRPGALPELRPAGRRADPRADRRADPRPARRHGVQRPRPGRPRPEGGIQGPLRRARPAPGYVRARVNGQVVALTDDLALDRQIKHNIEVVIDRLKAGPAVRPRLAEAVEAALKLGEGTVIVAAEGQPDLLLSSHYACAACGLSFDPPSPQLFSFNSPQGMCPACDGLGVRHDFDPDLLVPDPSLSVWNGAIEPLGPVKEMGKWRRHLFEGVAANLEADPDGPAQGDDAQGALARPRPEVAATPGSTALGDRVIVHRWKSRGKIWSHAEKWAGVANELLAKYQRPTGGPTRAQLEPYMRSMTCPDCQGARLNPRARAVRVGGKTLVELGRACRSARSPGSSTPWPASPPPTSTADETPDAARPALADDRRGAAQGDPRPARVPDQRRPALPDARPRRADALRRRGPADPAGQPGRRGAGRACSTSSTSPRSACTRATTTG